MNYHSVLLISLIALQSISSACADQQNPGASESTNEIPEIQKPSESEAISAIQKPSESEAIEAAVMYLNRDGQLTIQETEFLAWGTFSKQHAYWPMKLRMAYKSRGSDTLRHNEYAVKISKDNNGKLKAGQYYSWRTDFK